MNLSLYVLINVILIKKSVGSIRVSLQKKAGKCLFLGWSIYFLHKEKCRIKMHEETVQLMVMREF